MYVVYCTLTPITIVHEAINLAGNQTAGRRGYITMASCRLIMPIITSDLERAELCAGVEDILKMHNYDCEYHVKNFMMTLTVDWVAHSKQIS
jgi:hypothetical protein